MTREEQKTMLLEKAAEIRDSLEEWKNAGGDVDRVAAAIIDVIAAFFEIQRAVVKEMQ